MSRLEIRSFESVHVADAAALLALRHRRHRASQPWLPPRYEDHDAAAVEVSAAFAADQASGAVAYRGGQMIGYLLGSPKSTEPWGPNIWIESAGQASDEADVMRDLYGHAAARWVDEGRTAHYVLTPATDVDLVRAWFRVGFGQQHVHGVCGLPRHAAPVPAGLIIRRAIRSDIPALAQLDLELPLHQGLSPTFSSGRVGTLEESIADWESDFDSPDFATFVAERDGKVIGSAVGCALTKSSSHAGLARPDQAGFLGFAAVFPHARGTGAGRALGEAVLAWSAETGFTCVVTDWRVTNLLSSRAWPALGFEESFLRLHRLIGY
ncbi:MAG TPA: GNAT family N-acetyltransferase [Micromonosporaceae bacterium]